MIFFMYANFLNQFNVKQKNGMLEQQFQQLKELRGQMWTLTGII